MDAGVNSGGNKNYGFICFKCGLKVKPGTNMVNEFKGKTFIDETNISIN